MGTTFIRYYHQILIVALIIIVLYIAVKYSYGFNAITEDFSMISTVFDQRYQYLLKKDTKTTPYTQVFNEDPLVYSIIHNPDIKIIDLVKYINYHGRRITSRRGGAMVYHLYYNRLQRMGLLSLYPDFLNDQARHSIQNIQSYFDYFNQHILTPTLTSNALLVMNYTCYHGILDNKVRIWSKLVERYGRGVASQVMPQTYLIPDDFDIFKKEHSHYSNQGINKFVLKNALLGGKSGIRLTNKLGEIESIFKTSNDINKKCDDCTCLGKNKYNLIQPYLTNPFLIRGYKSNFRFYLVIFWNKNKICAKIYQEYYLSYASKPYSHTSTDFLEAITSYTGNSGVDDLDKTTIKLNRPNNHLSFVDELTNRGLDFNVFLNRLRANINKVVVSNLTDLIGLCRPNAKQFHIFAMDMEMDLNLNPILYEANHYYAIYQNIYGKLQSMLFQDIFYELGLTRFQNRGFWEVYPEYT
jgi:hypothetical protein